MDDLETWFGPLNARMGTDPQQPALGPEPEEAALLLEIGKLAAEAAPQRLFALLTAFAVGRALGRAEREDPGVDPLEYLRTALRQVQALASSL